MKLSEARRRYIGKKFRIVHAERGYYRRYVIENEVGVCTDIKAYSFGPAEYDGQFPPDDPIYKKYTFFKFRIDIPGIADKWFSVKEIEPVRE